MRIELERLDQEGGKFARTYEAGELSLDDDEVELVAPADVSGRVRRDGREVELTGQLRAEVVTGCNRCLQPVNLPIGAEFKERFVPAVSWRDEPQHKLQEEDLNLAVFDGEGIELDDLVREEILLAMPAHVLCRDDCQGLCPVCGIDRNRVSCQCETTETDSRWQGLKALEM
jgi:uncharacterized protein